jgi:hypothetical protein
MNILKKQAEERKLRRRNKREIREMLLGHAQSPEKSVVDTAETSLGFTEEINFTINNSES